MKYSENVDLLVASIIYLGTNAHYWGRSAKGLAEELGLDESRLLAVFEGFPGLFRRTKRKSKNGQHYYALQARHAQRDTYDLGDPDGDKVIPALDNDKVELLIKFVMQMTEQEKADRRGWWTSGIAMGAAVVSALTAICVALLRRC